jgi:hypothetical protein
MRSRSGDQPYVLAVSVRPEDASTTLFFGHLADRVGGTLRVVHYRQPDLAEQLSGASAIILVRALFELNPIIWFARLTGVPLYYFVDDNFILLREQPGIWSAYVEPYSARNVRERLRAFSGVLLSSRALLEYFEEHRLHARLLLFPPVGWPSTLPRPWSNDAAASVGFFGGSHLHGVLKDYVLPAIQRMAAVQPLRFVVAGVSEPVATSPGLTVVHQPYDPSYSRGLRTLAAAGVDVLVHPSLTGHANNAHKNPHALISAHAIGAVPVVSARPPYNDLPESGIVLQCEDTIDSWQVALKRALDPVEHRAVSDRLGSFCSAHFDGSINRQVIESLIGHPVSRPAGFTLARRMVAVTCLGVDFAWRLVRSAGSSRARIFKR